MHKLTKTALLSVSLLVVSGGAIAGNIPAIMESYPTVNGTLIELLTTIPSLFIILTILVSHKIARKIGYKQTVQLGIFLVFIAGILPVFTQSFLLLFLSRVAFGVGIGLFNPLLYSLAGNLYSGRDLATVIGLQSSFEGIGGMLITFSVGQLLIMNWRISFLAYGIALPVLLLFSFFVPAIQPTVPEKNTAAPKEKISHAVWSYVALLILVVTVYMSVTVKITSLLLDKGIGGATAGSNLIALVGLGAMLAGILFGRLVIVTKKWTLPLAFVGLALSMFLTAFAPNIIVASIAAILCGLAFRTFIPYLFNEVNQQSDNAEKSTSILLMAFNLGAAFAPITIAVFQQLLPVLNQQGLFIGEGILMLILAAGASLTNKKFNILDRSAE